MTKHIQVKVLVGCLCFLVGVTRMESSDWSAVDVPTRSDILDISISPIGLLSLLTSDTVVYQALETKEWLTIAIPVSAKPVKAIGSTISQEILLLGRSIHKYYPTTGKWIVVTEEEQNADFIDYAQSDGGAGFASARSFSLRTANGGDTFEYLPDESAGIVPSPATATVCKEGSDTVYTAGYNLGFFGSFGIVARSIDGGVQWTSLIPESPLTQNMLFYSLDAHKNLIVAAGKRSPITDSNSEKSDLLYSTNAGSTWSSSEAEFAGVLIDICLLDSVAGYCLDDIGIVYRSMNAGISWVQESVTKGNDKVLCLESVSGRAYAGAENGRLMTRTLSTSVADSHDDCTLNVYPNPASDHFFISADKVPNSPVVRVYSNTGELVSRSEMLSLPCSVDITTMPKGTYTVVLVDGPKHIHRRIVKH